MPGLGPMLGVGAVLVAIVAFLYSQVQGLTEENATQAVSIMRFEEADKHRVEIQKINQQFNDKLEEITNEVVRQSGVRQAEASMEGLDAEDRARHSPESFGDGVHDRLARIMCRMEAGTNTGRRQDCDRAPPDTFLTDFALTNTVTPDNSTRWFERCELWGQWLDDKSDTDFKEEHGITEEDRALCDWSITGFTPRGADIFLSWLERVEVAFLQRGLQLENIHARIRAMNEQAMKRE